MKHENQQDRPKASWSRRQILWFFGLWLGALLVMGIVTGLLEVFVNSLIIHTPRR